MLETMIYQLMKDATLEEIKEAGLDAHYAEHAKALFPTDASGVPFTTTYFATTGDPLADISEDMAAEQKARAVYENLIDLTDDPDVIGPLLWLRQREIVHYARFKELFEYFTTKKKNPLKGAQALVAVAMKFLRVMHYLVINKTKYDSSRVLGEYREQQIAA